MRLPIKQWMQAPTSASYFYTTVIGFLCGVFLYSFFQPGVVLPTVLFSVSLALLILIVFRTIPKTVLLVVFFLVSFVFGAVRMLVVPDVQQPFVAFDTKRVVVEGVISRDPDRRENATQLVVDGTSIEGENLSGRLLVTAERLADFSYGDSIRVEGKLELPEPFETATGKEFDYPQYLRAKGIGATISFPKILRTQAAEISLFGSLYFLKHLFEHSIEKIMPEPQGGLLEGILLGNRDALGKSWYELFIIAGLVHIVVLSGYNLSIIAEMLMRLLKKAPRKVAAVTGVTGVILFALMVGAEATVIRAAIMALIIIVGKALQRKHALLRALSFACAVMVLHNPLILTSDPSFALSFLATFGLVSFGSIFETKLKFIPERFGMRGIAAATLATQAFVLPALIFYTGRLSLVALPANLLALPLIPPAMLFGFIAGCIGLISSPLGVVAMIPSWILLSIVTTIVKVASSIPNAAISTASLQTPLIFCLYVVLIPLAIWAIRKTAQNPERFSKDTLPLI